MDVYKCVVEALDYGKNPNALKELKEMLTTFDTIKIVEMIVEGGDPIKDGAGAGYIVEIEEPVYHRTNQLYCKMAAKKYGVDEMFYRLGLAITEIIQY